MPNPEGCNQYVACGASSSGSTPSEQRHPVVGKDGRVIDGVSVETDASKINSVDMQHQTTAEAAEKIQEEGFNFSTNSTHGVGVYFADKSAGKTYGDKSIKVELSEHKQLSIGDDTEAPRIFSKITGMHVSQVMFDDRFPGKMVDAGYGSARFAVDDQTWTLVFDRSLIQIK